MVVVQGGTSKVKPIFEEIGQQLGTAPKVSTMSAGWPAAVPVTSLAATAAYDGSSQPTS